jgi:hypothetical protein
MVVEFGGFLDIGDKEVAIPIERFQRAEDGRMLLTDATEEELEQMPDYNENDYMGL